jgi:hypothetical protein
MISAYLKNRLMRLYATLRNERQGKKRTGDDTRIRVELAYGNKTVGELGLYAIRDYPSGEDLGYRIVWNGKVIEEVEKGKTEKGKLLCKDCGTTYPHDCSN